jgi:hypothetical protein
MDVERLLVEPRGVQVPLDDVHHTGMLALELRDLVPEAAVDHAQDQVGGRFALDDQIAGQQVIAYVHLGELEGHPGKSLQAFDDPALLPGIDANVQSGCVHVGFRRVRGTLWVPQTVHGKHRVGVWIACVPGTASPALAGGSGLPRNGRVLRARPGRVGGSSLGAPAREDVLSVWENGIIPRHVWRNAMQCRSMPQERRQPQDHVPPLIRAFAGPLQEVNLDRLFGWMRP